LLTHSGLKIIKVGARIAGEEKMRMRRGNPRNTKGTMMRSQDEYVEQNKHERGGK
jgi:hypothetical protein